MKKDYGKYFGSVMMFGFGLLALYRWNQTQLIFFLLLVLRDFVVAYFFLKREYAEIKSSKLISAIAYLSSAMPLFYFSPEFSAKGILLASNILAIIGFFFVALATIELGTSIGISPAKRSYVKTGIYKWISHPMYFGYVISEIGMIIVNPLNTFIFFISLILYFIRIKNENKIIAQL